MKFGRLAATTDADVLVYFVSICVFLRWVLEKNKNAQGRHVRRAEVASLHCIKLLQKSALKVGLPALSGCANPSIIWL